MRLSEFFRNLFHRREFDEPKRSKREAIVEMMEDYFDETHERLDPDSPVDRMKLAGLSDAEVTLDFRKRLAHFYGFQGDFTGKAVENEWLADKVMDDLLGD